MDKKTLLIFAKKIFNNSSETKAIVSLRQLQTLLEEQGASPKDIALLEQMIQSAPEMKETAQKTVLTELDVEIAERRARERKAREEAARNRGRC